MRQRRILLLCKLRPHQGGELLGQALPDSRLAFCRPQRHMDRAQLAGAAAQLKALKFRIGFEISPRPPAGRCVEDSIPAPPSTRSSPGG